MKLPDPKFSSQTKDKLVSSEVRPAVEGAAAKIYDGPGVREASDHRPVVVTLQFNAAK